MLNDLFTKSDWEMKKIRGRLLFCTRKIDVRPYLLFP